MTDYSKSFYTRKALAITSFFVAIFLLCACSHTAYAQGQRVLMLEIDDTIGPASSQFIGSNLNSASPDKYQAVILKLNTPGGLVTSMRSITEAILASDVPVITWVAPSGAHAASAGTFILYASHVAAMAPGTNIGAAAPVAMGGNQNEKQNQDSTAIPMQKAMQDLAAYMRSLSEIHGRNPDWGESAVTEAKAISAEDALKKGVIDVIAADETALLAQIDGKQIAVKGETVTLKTNAATIVTVMPDWRSRLIGFLTNPNLTFILITLGIYGLIFEMKNPGAFFPGVIGAICLILAFIAMDQLPVNYGGLALLILGIFLMIAELFITAFGIMGVGGAIAFGLGATMLYDNPFGNFGVSYSVIASTMILVCGTMFALLWYILKTQTSPVVTGSQILVGKTAQVVDWQGENGRVRLQGEIWKASAPAPLSLQNGDTVIVTHADNLTLTITGHANYN